MALKLPSCSGEFGLCYKNTKPSLFLELKTGFQNVLTVIMLIAASIQRGCGNGGAHLALLCLVRS